MKSIGPQIWIEERPFELPLFGDVGVRMTVIQLKGGGLVLISPVPLTEELLKELANLGPVRFLVGPNSMHHLYLSEYHRRFPDAALTGPHKLAQKRKDLSFAVQLDESSPSEWADEIITLKVDSPGSMAEIVFFHSPSRTLIVTDLLFHIQNADSAFQRTLFRLNGCYQKLAMTRIGRLLWKDRSELSRKVEQIAGWDFDRIILAHGEIVTSHGREKFLQAFSWL